MTDTLNDLTDKAKIAANWAANGGNPETAKLLRDLVSTIDLLEEHHSQHHAELKQYDNLKPTPDNLCGHSLRIHDVCPRCGMMGALEYMTKAQQREIPLISAEQAKMIAEELHYPDCWDTMAYPSLFSAVYEISNCNECAQPTKRELIDDTLPKDVHIGAAVFKKGVKLDTLINAATRWHKMASDASLVDIDVKAALAALDPSNIHEMDDKEICLSILQDKFDSLYVTMKIIEDRGEPDDEAVLLAKQALSEIEVREGDNG